MKRKILLSLCLALGLASLAWTQAPDPSQIVRRIGLFVGANDGGPEREKLQWAVSDALHMGEVMTELGGMDKSDLVILSDPRVSELQAALAKAKTMVRQAAMNSRRVEFMFYYSGHSDENGLLLSTDRMVYPDLRKAITDMKADISIAVLDSCASGAFTRAKGGVRVQPFLVDGSSDMKGYAFLTSASATESAQESDRLGSSFFTHYLISALRGAADNTGDGRITLNEAYHYAFDETLARTEDSSIGPQHPSYDIQLNGSGDLVLSDLSQPSAVLVLQDSVSGKISIRDQKSYLVMEVNKNQGKPMTLAIEPGIYSIRIEAASGVYTANAKLIFRQQVSISPADYQKAQLTSARARGNASSGQAPADSRDSARGDTATDQAVGDQSGQDAGTASDDSQSLTDLSGIGNWKIDSTDLALGRVPSLPDSPQPQGPQLTPQPAPGPEESPSPGDGSGSSIDVPFHLSFVPGISTAGTRADVRSTVSLSPLISLVLENRGAMASGLLNIDSGLENGYQAAGLINIAGELSGAQTSGIGNISRLGARGFQGAGIFNIAGDSIEGVQAAGVFNIGASTMNGVQLAGVFNRATEIKGVQISGALNIADSISGVQIGLVNIARHMDGLPVGLVNVIVDGIHDVGYFATVNDRNWVTFMNGSKSFYSIVFAGMDKGSDFADLQRLVVGAGLGVRLKLGPLYSDLEISAKRPSTGTDSASRLASLFNAVPGQNGEVRFVPGTKAVIGFDLGFLKAYVGASLDFLIPGLMSSADYVSADSSIKPYEIPGTGVNLDTSIVLGLSFSF